MKVISKETAPTVEFGDKVRTKTAGRLQDLLTGTVGVVTSEGVDSDGEVAVRVPADYDFFKPEDLEVLQKFSGEEIEVEKPATVELTVDDIKHITAALFETATTTANAWLANEGIKAASEDNALLFWKFKALLQEVA